MRRISSAVVVDSNRAMRLLLRRALIHTGQVDEGLVAEANDVPTALAALADADGDAVVVTEWDLRDGEPGSLVASLRRRGFGGIVGVATADTRDTTRDEARKAGAHFVLHKPVAAPALAAALVESLLEEPS